MRMLVSIIFWRSNHRVESIVETLDDEKVKEEMKNNKQVMNE